jgi:integrase
MAQKLKLRSDGRFVKTITDKKTKKRIFFYGDSERELNQKILAYERKRELGRTFAEVAEEWWGEALKALSPSSYRGYRVAKERAVEEFGDMPIKDITARDINALVLSLASKGYAKATVRNYKIVVNRIFSHALREGDINYSPSAAVDLPHHLKTNKRHAATPNDEAIIKQSADVWLMPYFALMSGLRKGELLALQWRDVDFSKNIIYVTKSVYYNNAPVIKSTKTESGIRIVPLLKPLKSVLQAHQANARPELFILSGTATPLTNKQFRTRLKNFQEKTGITATLHQLRKSFATFAVKEGVPPKTLQSILGHKNISTTLDIYTEVRKESIDSAADILNAALGV